MLIAIDEFRKAQANKAADFLAIHLSSWNDQLDWGDDDLVREFEEGTVDLISYIRSSYKEVI